MKPLVFLTLNIYKLFVSIHIRTCTSNYIYNYKYARIPLYNHLSICIYIDVHICIHTCLFYMYIILYIHIYIYLCVYIYIVDDTIS